MQHAGSAANQTTLFLGENLDHYFGLRRLVFTYAAVRAILRNWQAQGGPICDLFAMNRNGTSSRASTSTPTAACSCSSTSIVMLRSVTGA